MNQKLLLGWAVAATALALVFLGFALGKRTTGEPVRHAAAPAYSSPNTDGSGAGVRAEAVERYVVPDIFAGLPPEWRSAFDGRDFNGYAILFDPQRREVIVEKCRHPGYIDARTGTVIEPGWEFCMGVLWASLTRIDDNSATVVDRKRGAVELTLALTTDKDVPRLSLTFGKHDMTLIPGSKNDLLQAMEKAPVMQQQKDRFIKAMVAQEEARRRVAQQSGNNGSADDVPTYVLPAADDRRETTE